MAETGARVPLSSRIASAHGLNWHFDNRYRWAWYIWPQAVGVLAAAWLLGGGIAGPAPTGPWSKPAEVAGSQMDSLRDAAKTDPAARERLKRLAEAGDPFAQFSYATLYDPVFKFTAQQDIGTALEWYLKAANLNHPVAQSNYGLRHYYGQGGLKVDYDKAFPWLLKGAQQGNTNAQAALGEAYKFGRGTKEDLSTALQWFRTAGDNGDSYSQAEMGDAYAQGKGIAQNMTEAIAWYRKAADKKWAYAERKLGIIYLYGQNGVQRDPASAYEFLKRAADSGDMVAQFYLAYMYEQGIYVKEDVATALTWYRKSADQGWADAQNALGLAYLKGSGVPKDKDTAKTWFEKAAAGGNKDAAESLKTLGGTVPQRREDADDTQPAPAPDLNSARTCLDEENPGIADGVCRVFIGNNAGLSKATLNAVYAKLARVSLQLKDYKSALTYSNKALEIAPTAVQHYISGQAYAGMKDTSSAVREFGAALSMAPKYLLAYHRRGEAYLALGDATHAKNDFESALSLAPTFTPSVEAMRRIKRR